MIRCWFSEQGFVVDGEKLKSRLVIDDCSDDIYDARWHTFGRMLDTLLAAGEIIQIPVVVHHDSRLVEELNNQLDPLNDYAKQARAYFLAHDSPLLPFLQIKKVNSNTISRVLLASGESSRSSKVAKSSMSN